MAGGGVAVRLGQILDPVVPTIAIEVTDRGHGPFTISQIQGNVLPVKVASANANANRVVRRVCASKVAGLGPRTMGLAPINATSVWVIPQKLGDQGKMISAHVVAF